jgi:hypothetical protein
MRTSTIPSSSSSLSLTIAPVFAWEICLAMYLIAKGFRPVAVPAGVVEPELVPVA